MTTILVCRTCLAHDTSMHTIANTPLQFFYENITNLSLNTKDGRSTVVCYNCYDVLNKCYGLVEIAIRADEVLQQICKNGIKITEEYISMIDRTLLLKLNNSSDPVVNSESKMTENVETVCVKEEILSDNEQEISDDIPTEAPKDEPQFTTHFEIKIETDLNIEGIDREGRLPSDDVDGDGRSPSKDVLQSRDEQAFIDDLPLDITIKEENVVEAVPENYEQGPVPTQLKLQQTTKSPERLKLQSSPKKDITRPKVKTKRTDKSNKQNKLKKSKSPKEFSCDQCDYKSIRKYDLTRHTRRIHNRVTIGCSECEKSSKESDLTGHNSHTCDRPFICDHCHKRFTLKGDLSRHIKTHTDDNQFTCNYCGNKYTQKSNLQRHISTHWGEKPFICSFCGNKFTQKSNLERHVRIHRGERPFKCSFCEKTYSQKIHLTQHLMTHTGEKPYNCIYCERKFSQKRVLAGHVRMHRGEKPFTCRQCGSNFAQKSYLARHFRTHMSRDSGNY